MNFKKNLALLLTLSAINGCASKPFIGKENLVASSREHKEYLHQSELRTYENDKSTIYRTVRTEQEYSVSLQREGYRFYTRKVSSGSFIAIWEPPKAKQDVIIVNGIGSNATNISLLAQSLLEENVRVYAVDRTGSGLNCSKKPDSKVWRRDIIEIAKKSKRPIIISQCFSTGLVADICNKNPNLFSKAIYLTPGIYLNYEPECCDKISMCLEEILMLDNRHKNPVPIEAYTKDKDSIETLYNDALFSYYPTKKTFLEGNKLNKEALKKIRETRIPYLLILAERDEVVNNKKTIEELKKLNFSKETIKILSSDHFLLLDRKAIEAIKKEILRTENEEKN